MKRFVGFFLMGICLLSLIVPSIVLAADSVPEKALQAMESVYRVLCEDAEYMYSGSSFIVGADDQGTYLVTNYHVIDGANPQSIVVVEHDGTKLPASVVGYDEDYDLCILQTDQPIKGAVAINISPQGASVGEAVYALGYPGAGDYLLDDYAYAVEDITVTDGIVSAVKTVTTGAKKTTFLQMNAAINPGSSGGPLLNGEGQVVGVNTLGILEAQDVYAAVSSSHIIGILRQYSIPLQSSDQAQAEPAAVRLPSPGVWLQIGVCAALVLAVTALLIIRSRRLTLAVLLARRLHGYPIEEALRRLAPVFRTLTRLHARGEVHGYVCPTNLYVDHHGILHLGGKRRKSVFNENTKSFISIEQYDNNTQSGTYSDVYALGAVLFSMLTCTQPPDVITRLQSDTLEEKLQGIQGLSEHMRGTLSKAMALKKEERLHDIEQFLHAVEFSQRDEPCSQTPETDLAFRVPLDEKKENRYDMRRISKPRFAVLDKKRKRRLVAFSCSGALLLIFATLLLINESSYRRTVACCKSMDYAGAYKAIGSAFLFYRDTRTLNDFVSAGLYLEVGRYQEAKDRFLALGDYRNARDMVLECDYQKACALLSNHEYEPAKALFMALKSYSNAGKMSMECDYQNAKDLLHAGKYDDAKKLFTELAKGSFRDSSTMVQEVDYQHAKDVYNVFLASNKRNKTIQKALDLLQSLNEYKDSKALLDKIENEIYLEAVETFNECIYVPIMDIFGYKKWGQNAPIVKQYFQMLNGFKDSRLYFELCQSMDNNDSEQTCRFLTEQWDFIPARNVLLSDRYIEYFLLGTWRGEGYYFRLYDRGDRGIYSSYDIPWISGKYYKIENLIFYTGSDEDGWRKMYTFNVINEDLIEIYAHKNGRTYTLYRQ